VTRNEARRIAANVAKLPEPVSQGVNPALKNPTSFQGAATATAEACDKSLGG
jgi:hypothetical protein